MHPNSGGEPKPVYRVKGAVALPRSPVGSAWQGYRNGVIRLRRGSRLPISAGVLPVHCTRLNSKLHAAAADEARCVDTSEGRSEDSAGMVHGSNTRPHMVENYSGNAQRLVIEAAGGGIGPCISNSKLGESRTG